MMGSIRFAWVQIVVPVTTMQHAGRGFLTRRIAPGCGEASETRGFDELTFPQKQKIETTLFLLELTKHTFDLDNARGRARVICSGWQHI